MKVFESSCAFNYSWNEVSVANWRKYCPWNQNAPHVLAVDTLSRSVDPSTGALRTERIITCQQTAPAWILALIGGKDVSHVYEVSTVDPKSKKITMVSQNLTYNNILSVQETCKYNPHPDAPDTKTLFEQDAKVTAVCGGWQRVKTGLEDWTVERFGQNAARGREGFEQVLATSRRVMSEEGQKAGAFA